MSRLKETPHQWLLRRIEFLESTVLVVTRNRKDVLRRVLTALGRQMGDGDRLVVVDDASTDGTEQMVRHRIPETRLGYLKIKHHEGYRLSTRINQGLELAEKGRFPDHTVRLDADCIPVRAWLDAHRRLWAKDRVVAGGLWRKDERGRVVDKDRWRMGLMGKIKRDQPRVFERWRKTYELPHGLPVCCFGGNLGFSRERALEIGGFPADFEGGWGAEDAWFCDQLLWKLRIRLFYAPGVAVVHQWHPAEGEHRDPEAHQRNLELWRKLSTEMRSRPPLWRPGGG